MKESELELFQLLSTDSEKGLIRIYDIYRGEFINWCIKAYSTNEDDAADIFQDSVIALYYNIRSGQLTELTSSLKSYLFAIGKNTALKKINKQSKLLINDDVVRLSGQFEQIDHFEDEDKKKVVAALLDKLGEPCKSILTLFYFDKFSMDAIANRLGYKNEHVVKAQKLRCFNSLKKMTLERFNQDQL